MNRDLLLLTAYFSAPSPQSLLPILKDYSGLVFATALNVARHEPQRAIIIFAEVFGRMIRNAQANPKADNLAAWLHASTLKVAREVDALPDAFTTPAISCDDVTASWSAMPEVDEAISSLPPQVKQMFLLSTLCGLSAREVADRFAVRVPVTEVVLHDAWSTVLDRKRPLARYENRQIQEHLQRRSKFHLPSGYLASLSRHVHAASDGLRPRMSEREIRLFERCVQQSSCYFEYGVGGSTLAAAALAERGRGPSTILGVDTDPQWVATVSHEARRFRVDMSLSHVDIGPVLRWGYPRERQPDPRWKHFPAAIGNQARRAAVDLVLIDSRFRVACLLETFIACGSRARVLFHDFGKREEYSVVEQWATMSERAGSLAVLVKRPDVDPSRASFKEALERYSYQLS